MIYEDNVERLQDKLRGAGYGPVSAPVDLSNLDKENRVVDCEIVARKDFFDILYLEAESNWRSIASQISKQQENPCLLITRYSDTHHIFTTIRDHGTRNAKPRHVVLETGSKPKLMKEFMQAIKTEMDDDHVTVDGRVQAAFERFSEYKQAVDEFGKNLGDIIKTTESSITDAISGNKKYEVCAKKMLKMCHEVISNNLDMSDIKSMLLQHILTYRIFALVYDVTDFHETNAVAKSLEDLKQTLHMPQSKTNYKTIELIAESLTETDERQEFLKKVYETFYEKYDPDRADKDGIVYTPSEVVNFMVKSTEQLLQKHFGRSMSDEGVTLLDPATGTGTFLVHIMRQIGSDKIKEKYAKDLHANEISILPYYIATLNIEHAYMEMTGEYREFDNICWMDTLDSGVKDYAKLTSYFENDDNIKRMSRQQDSSIQVAIGNPPYNAVQTSFNKANPTDKYDHIDKKIQEDYYINVKIRNKNKSFDMYKRFLKWSSDRIQDNGMVVFVSNNSFLDAKADNGVRRKIYNEFDHIYVINLKGNARTSGKRRRMERDNIFHNKIRVGIAISFFIKTGKKHNELKYTEVADYARLGEKLEWLDKNTISDLDLKEIIPNKDSIWLNQTDNNFEKLVPVLPKTHCESIFYIGTPGVTVAKDAWAYDFDLRRLKTKMKYYISTYNSLLQKHTKLDTDRKELLRVIDKTIKWSQRTLDGLSRNQHIEYSSTNIKPTLYRPFVIKNQYYDNVITERQRAFPKIFQNQQKNFLIVFPNPATNTKFDVVGTNLIVDLGCLNVSQNIPLLLYDDNRERTYNVTEYGINLFRKHYKNSEISAEEVFYYVYAIFNDPKYENTYRYNLRRDFPRIPLARNFVQLAKIGRELFELHCNFNNAKEYDLYRVDKKNTRNNTRLSFKKNKNNIKIVIDDATIIEGIPLSVLDWTFKSKTPLEWILEFYKESKNQIKPDSSDDVEIRKRFNTYSFEDHKEEVITLLRQVTTVCVETVRLRKELEGMEWGPQPKLKFTPIQEPEAKAVTKKTLVKKIPRIRLAHQKKLVPGPTQSTFVNQPHPYG